MALPCLPDRVTGTRAVAAPALPSTMVTSPMDSTTAAGVQRPSSDSTESDNALGRQPVRRVRFEFCRGLKQSNRERNHMANLLCGCGLLYNGDGDPPSAQTVRRAVPGR